MENYFRYALWATFLLYLTVSYVNTAGLAAHFEPNVWICNLWALAVEVGDVTLLLGTLKRKVQGKAYGGYLATFLVSLAVSLAANVAEWTNNFIGNNTLYHALHDFSNPWMIPALLGVTIPALMLATGSMLSDFLIENKINGQIDSKVKEMPEMDFSIPTQDLIKPVVPMNISAGEDASTDWVNNRSDVRINPQKNLNDISESPSQIRGEFNNTSPEIQLQAESLSKTGRRRSSRSKLSYDDLFSVSVKELSERYNVTQKTIYNWRNRAQL
ncbi:MAG: hypothetical protein ACHQYP_08775, partial [Nitrospiria bacterium]